MCQDLFLSRLYKIKYGLKCAINVNNIAQGKVKYGKNLLTSKKNGRYYKTSNTKERINLDKAFFNGGMP
jgi:hypothetical protein